LVRASCGGGIEVRVEGGFMNGIREESPGISDEACGFGEGERGGAVGVGAIEEEREASVL
jgi:hypothetical protein